MNDLRDQGMPYPQQVKHRADRFAADHYGLSLDEVAAHTYPGIDLCRAIQNIEARWRTQHGNDRAKKSAERQQRRRRAKMTTAEQVFARALPACFRPPARNAGFTGDLGAGGGLGRRRGALKPLHRRRSRLCPPARPPTPQAQWWRLPETCVIAVTVKGTRVIPFTIVYGLPDATTWMYMCTTINTIFNLLTASLCGLCTLYTHVAYYTFHTRPYLVGDRFRATVTY